ISPSCGCGDQPPCEPCKGKDCGGGPPPTPGPGSGGPTEIIVPGDPNEKTGPSGYGPESFVGSGQAFPYVIYFQNQPTASAPAQEVFVTDRLPADLDWSTFTLGEAAFGDQVVDDLAGRSSCSVTVPLKNSSLVVTISVDFNPASGVAQWVFRTIDPRTN